MGASYSTDTYTPEQLMAGGDDYRSKGITLLSGQNLKRGAVLGKITLGTASTSGAGNTGNGTITMDVAAPVLAGAKVGAYVATCIAAATNGGTFRVEDPDGFVLGDVAVGATFADDIKFVIADGGTDFVVGDKFTITVAAGSGKHVLCLAAATDGSQTPDLILAEDTDASGGDVVTVAYFGGDFIDAALTFGTGHSYATVFDTLRAKGINILKALA